MTVRVRAFAGRGTCFDRRDDGCQQMFDLPESLEVHDDVRATIRESRYSVDVRNRSSLALHDVRSRPRSIVAHDPELMIAIEAVSNHRSIPRLEDV